MNFVMHLVMNLDEFCDEIFDEFCDEFCDEIFDEFCDEFWATQFYIVSNSQGPRL